MKLTRRAALLSPAALARAQETPKSKYTGALDRFAAQVDAATMDPVLWSRLRYDDMPRRMRFTAASRTAAEAWQRRLRLKVGELLGGLPARRAPLNPKTLEKREFPTYWREAVIFDSRPGLSVFAYILTPKQGPRPFPAAICIPGHGRGVDDIAGVDAEGRDRTDKDGYQHDFAIQVVEQGLAAVAIEPLGFGCRRGDEAKRRGLGANSCQPAAGAALLFGETMIGWRVWDVMRTIDFIETRPELDARRVGCLGISGGGTITVFASALETRIRAALVSGYLNTFKDSILSLAHCIDNYVPGILNWAEMSDVAGLIAPRALWAESGERDNIFPIAASRQAFAEVQRIYQVFGAANRCGHEVFDNGHSFSGVRGLPFLRAQLREG
jgi:dienelactone hydrolase